MDRDNINKSDSKKRRRSADIFDDSSIDWDEAIRLMDEKTCGIKSVTCHEATQSPYFPVAKSTTPRKPSGMENTAKKLTFRRGNFQQTQRNNSNNSRISFSTSGEGMVKNAQIENININDTRITTKEDLSGSFQPKNDSTQTNHHTTSDKKNATFSSSSGTNPYHQKKKGKIEPVVPRNPKPSSTITPETWRNGSTMQSSLGNHYPVSGTQQNRVAGPNITPKTWRNHSSSQNQALNYFSTQRKSVAQNEGTQFGVEIGNLDSERKFINNNNNNNGNNNVAKATTRRDNSIAMTNERQQLQQQQKPQQQQQKEQQHQHQQHQKQQLGALSIHKNDSNKITKSNGVALPLALQFSASSVQPVKDKHRQNLVKHANLSAPLLNGWTLFSHQKKAILRALLMRRMICSLDMGLGKTLIGCVWAKAFHKVFDCKVYVICPVSLKKDWKRTAEDATGLQVLEDNPTPTKTSRRKKKGKDKEEESSDEKENAEEESNEEDESPYVYISSWSKIPPVPPPSITKYVVICDEAHSIQSMQSARTKDTLKLVQPARCVGVLLLTGTPMKNGKPLNLFPLLRAVQHPFGKNQKAYETHFCAGQQKSVGKGRVLWNACGSSNLNQLRELVSSHLLYLSKEQCLLELPPMKRVFRHVAVSGRFHTQHEKAMNYLANIYNCSEVMENKSEAILGAVQRVRFIGSLAKIDASVEMTKKVLEVEPAVVIFSSFVEVAKSVHKKLSDSGWEGELLTGETPANKRQEMVDNFQNGLSPVFVCTFGAGGVGLTLTAAHTVIMLDRPWTPGDAAQAEDRLRRIGQTKPVTSIWVSAFDLDKQIDGILEQKKQTSNAVLAEGTTDGTGTSCESVAAPPKISIFRMLRSVLPASAGGASAPQGNYNSSTLSQQEVISQRSIDSYVYSPE